MTRSAILPLFLLLASCGYEDSRAAHQAQISLEGMTAHDLQSCAGIPERTSRLDPRTEIYSYSLRNDASGGMDLTLPMLGGLKLGGAGSSCTAIFRLTDGKVSHLSYAGRTDPAVGQDGVCEPIIRGCLRRPQPSMGALTPEAWSASSAYRQPEPSPPAPR